MIDRVCDTEKLNTGVHVFTSNRIKDGKDIILCELACHDKVNNRYYHGVYPASKFNEICQLYYSLNRGEINPNNIKGLIW